MGNIISQLLHLWELKSKIIGSLAEEEVPGGCIDASEDLDFLTIVSPFLPSPPPLLSFSSDGLISFLSSQDVISQVAFGASYGQLEETIALVEQSGASISPTRSKPAKFPSKMSALAEASKLFFESVPAVGPATDKASYFLRFVCFSSLSLSTSFHHRLADSSLSPFFAGPCSLLYDLAILQSRQTNPLLLPRPTSGTVSSPSPRRRGRAESSRRSDREGDGRSDASSGSRA